MKPSRMKRNSIKILNPVIAILFCFITMAMVQDDRKERIRDCATQAGDGANPLQDIANVRQQAGVMVNGRWLTHNSLQTMLNSLVASYTPTLIERLWPVLLIAAAAFLFWRQSVKRGE